MANNRAHGDSGGRYVGMGWLVVGNEGWYSTRADVRPAELTWRLFR